MVGQASIEETEGTYGHLQLEPHEHRVDRLDKYLGVAGAERIPRLRSFPSRRVPQRPTWRQMPSNCLKTLMVEGKGFVSDALRNGRYFESAFVQNTAKRYISRNQAQPG